MFQALVEIAGSVAQEVEWELVAPNTLCLAFATNERAVLFVRLIGALPTTGVVLLGTEVIVTW
jgi:hypothetical protein